MDPCLALLRDLVAIDSVNPSLVPGAAGEIAIAERVAAHMRSIGLDVELQEAAPGRPNVIGILDGRSASPSLMYCGHLDTVGVEGMERPFDPLERDGRLYGRGSQDMKGGVAAMIDAARRLAARRPRPGRLIVAAVVDEEFASLGAEALVTRWHADAAVVTEPTELRMALGHKGFAWIDIETRGRAAHGSRPEDGRDAIIMMGRVLQRLGELDRELRNRPPDPLLGTGSLHAAIIAGGRELSSYPERCSLQMERRTLPSEPAVLIEQEVAGILEALARESPAFRAGSRLRFSRPAYRMAGTDPLPQALAAVLRQMGRPDGGVGMSFWTDAAILHAAGIPAVLFGPGGAGLHSMEEYVAVGDVLACREALVALADRWLG